MSSSWQRSVPDMWECLLWIWFGLMVLSLCSINVEYSYHNQMFRSTPICFFYLKKSADVAIVLVHVFWELTLLFKNDLIVISKYCMFLILFNWNILRIVILFNVYFYNHRGSFLRTVQIILDATINICMFFVEKSVALLY